MIPHGERLPLGWCQHCGQECRDRLGADIYPDRPDLAEEVIWECVFCGARVGTHKEGPHKGKPLGTAANEELRKARVHCHALVDPIWQRAYLLPDYASARQHPLAADRTKALAIIKRTARVRVYAYMGEVLGLGVEHCHIAMLDLEECRALYRAMRGVSYAQIREWSQERRQSSLPPGDRPG